MRSGEKNPANRIRYGAFRRDHNKFRLLTRCLMADECGDIRIKLVYAATEETIVVGHGLAPLPDLLCGCSY